MPVTNERRDLYSPWVGLIYVFNLIVGTGALTLPAVFASAGWLLSLILITMLGIAGYVTVTFIVECMACANATLHWKKIQSHKIDGESEAILDSDTEEEVATEETAIISRRHRYYTLNEQIELGQMASLYFNKGGRMLFFISLCVYLYGDLTIYTTAVAKTLADLTCTTSNDTNKTDNFDTLCWEWSNLHTADIYRIFVLLFALTVGPFSYFNVQKTKYLQVVTSTMRWCAFSIMIILASIRLFENGQQGFPPVARFSGVPALLGASVYSFMCHHSLPGLIGPIADKRNVVRLLGLDYVLICSFYLLLAITGSFAFSNLYDLYTLNFVPSTFNKSGIFMEIIEYYLGLFPVFTLSTSFPIIAITLQNNLKALFLDVNVIEGYHFVIRRLVFPTVVVLPPVLVALTTHNVKSLVEFTGTYGGAAIQYVIPAMLVWCARYQCDRNIGNSAKNKYSSPFKSKFWIIFILCWSVVSVILVTANLLS